MKPQDYWPRAGKNRCGMIGSRSSEWIPVLDREVLNELGFAPKLLQGFYADRIFAEINAHKRSVDPSSFAPSEYRIAEFCQKKKKFNISGRSRQSQLSSVFRHIDQLTIDTPGPVNRHNSHVKGGFKFDALRALTSLYYH
jgi:hypothetical protein